MVEGINQVVNVTAVDLSPCADAVGAVRVVDQDAAVVEGSQAIEVIIAVRAQGLGVVGLSGDMRLFIEYTIVSLLTYLGGTSPGQPELLSKSSLSYVTQDCASLSLMYSM